MARLRSKTGSYDQGIIASSSAPSAAFVGQIWFNNATGVVYQWTTDGASSFWLDISSGGIGTSAERGVDFVGDIDPHKATNGTGLAVGSVYYNREKNRHFICTDATSGANVWSGRYAGAGGVESDCLIGGVYYKVHTFLSSSTFEVEDAMNVDWLIVGGGASGGVWHGAGGGAGGFRTGANHAVTTQSYSIVVGGGGAKRDSGAGLGNDGSPSSFNSIVSAGGGGGGHYGGTSGVAGRAGASGGGGGSGGAVGTQHRGAGGTVTGITPVTGEVTTVQGYAGGLGGSSGNVAGGGGGGAGAVGSPVGTGGNFRGGPGGVGKAEIMGLSAANTKILLDAANVGEADGSSRYVAGGGGGTSNYSANYRGVGGLGGGGDGAHHGSSDNGQDGTAGTGGGGGGSSNNTGCISGAGGSGVVIIRYALN